MEEEEEDEDDEDEETEEEEEDGSEGENKAGKTVTKKPGFFCVNFLFKFIVCYLKRSCLLLCVTYGSIHAYKKGGLTSCSSCCMVQHKIHRIINQLQLQQERKDVVPDVGEAIPEEAT